MAEGAGPVIRAAAAVVAKLHPRASLELDRGGNDGALGLVGNLSSQVGFPLQSVVTRELTLYGSCSSRGEYAACLDMIDRGAVDVAALISEVAPLADGALWFDRLYQGESGLLKVILRP